MGSSKKEEAANAKNGVGDVYNSALILLVFKVTQFNEQRVVECKNNCDVNMKRDRERKCIPGHVQEVFTREPEHKCVYKNAVNYKMIMSFL